MTGILFERPIQLNFSFCELDCVYVENFPSASFSENKMDLEDDANVANMHDPIVLLDSQKEHYARMNQLLSKRKFLLDFSMLGAGKT